MKLLLAALLVFRGSASSANKWLRGERRKSPRGARKNFHQEKLYALQRAWDSAADGANFAPHIALLHMYRLQEIIEQHGSRAQHVRIVAHAAEGRPCSACRALDGEVFPLGTERRRPHLPVAGCTCVPFPSGDPGFCVCEYEPVLAHELADG